MSKDRFEPGVMVDLSRDASGVYLASLYLWQETCAGIKWVEIAYGEGHTRNAAIDALWGDYRNYKSKRPTYVPDDDSEILF